MYTVCLGGDRDWEMLVGVHLLELLTKEDSMVLCVKHTSLRGSNFLGERTAGPQAFFEVCSFSWSNSSEL